MAIITNTVVPGTIAGIREDLSDIIKMISPTSTPFITNAGTGPKCDNHYVEWQTDELAAAVGTNKRVIGDDFGSTYTAITATTRIGNYVQKSTKDVISADDLEWINKAGRSSEMAMQMAKKGKELKRDVEMHCVGNYAAVAPAASTAGVSGSIVAYIKTNVDKASDGTTPSWTTKPDAVRVYGTARTFTEDQLKTVISLAWTEGGEPDTIMVGKAQKMAFSGFAGIAQTRKDVPGNKQAVVVGAADVYVSDFGDFKVVPSRYVASTDALILDFGLIQMSYLGPKYRQVNMAKTGLAEKRVIETNFTLRVLQEKGLGIVTDLA